MATSRKPIKEYLLEDQEESDINETDCDDLNSSPASVNDKLWERIHSNASFSPDENDGLLSTKFSILYVIFILIIAFLGGTYSRAIYSNILISNNVDVKDNGVNDMFEYVMSTVKEKFKSQEPDFGFSIFTALENLSKHPATPAVYLLLLDEKSKPSAFCVVEMISIAAKKLLPNHKGWLLINGDKLSSTRQSDPGLLMETISENMNHSKLVVVSDLNKIPSKLAAGFHSLVDQYNPKIRMAVYVFTLISSNSQNNSKPIEIVEETLSDSWMDLNVNLRSPLITRVTDAILRINPEPSQRNCPLERDTAREITEDLI